MNNGSKAEAGKRLDYKEDCSHLATAVVFNMHFSLLCKNDTRKIKGNKTQVKEKPHTF